MKSLSVRISLILVSILLIASSLPQVQAQDLDEGSFILTQSTSTGIQFEVQVPLDSLDLDSFNQDGQAFTQVNLPGAAATAEAEAPQLPLMSQLLAVPFGVEIELKIQPGKSSVIEIENPVLPVPTQTIDWLPPDNRGSLLDAPQAQLLYEPNQEIYTADLSYPGKLGEIVNDGVIRQQRVVSVALYPVQYNPSRSELTLYESFSVTLSFKGGIQTAKSLFEQESTAYEELFRQKLLNYSTSHAWRLPVSQQELPETSQTLLSEVNTLPWTPPDPAWRIKVIEEGIHRITYAELLAAGLDVETLDHRTFRMFYQGTEIAIWVEGQADGRFESTDFILFFAEPLQDKYTPDNVYWLTYGGVANGLRMQTRTSIVPNNSAETYFIDQTRSEINKNYLPLAVGDNNYERFLWDLIFASGDTPKDWTYTFSLNAPVADPFVDCTLDLELLGYTNLPEGHHAEVYVNDQWVGELFWQGRNWAHLSASFTADLLAVENTLKIVLPNDQGAIADWIYVERFSLSYPSVFRAENNSIEFDFDLDGGNRFDLDGFSTDLIYLFDTSDPGNPQILMDSLVQADGLEYTLSFQEAAGVTGEHSYLAVGSETLKQVHAIEQDTSTLEDPLNGADYLIITHEDFLTPAQALANYRQSQGLRTMVVNVQDIYDQFGYGIVGKDPIHAFLSYVYQNWAAPAPSYVVLMGDGHYNPKGYNPAEYGAWRESFIPPYLAYADPALGETAADNRYVTFDGEGDMLPDMMLGRMAVMTADQANAFVNKIMAYEQNPSTIDWQTPVLAVADNSDYGGNFPAISQFLLSSSLPDEYQAQRVYLGITHADMADAKTAVIDAINSGKFLVNYIGHGATHQWADSVGLLAVNDVAGLTNPNKYPIISAMTCKEGYYINPHATGSSYESLAEVITRAENKGAIASWSPTGNSVATGHDIIDRELFVAIFSDLVPRMGQATQQSLLDLWASGTYLDLIDTYLLFGDPALLFKRGLTAISDEYQVNEDEILEVPGLSFDGVLENDLNPENLSLTTEFVDGNGPFNGTLTAFNPDGSFSYTPNADFFGTDSFTYRVYDGSNYSNTATVTITVNPVNDPPVADSQTVVTNEDTPIDITLTASDDGGGGGTVSSQRLLPSQYLENQLNEEGLTFTVLDPGPEHGMLSGEAPNLTYTPDSGYIGSDSFTFIANDGEYDSNIAKVSITIIEAPPENIYLPLILR